jgi:MFS family permease
MQNVALSWLVYRLTDSVFLLGLVGFTTQIPTFILSPFTGVYTDKHDKLRIMIGAQIMFMIQAVALAVLTLTEMAQVCHIVALSLLFGIISAFDAPARQSLVVDLIDEPEIFGGGSAVFR